MDPESRFRQLCVGVLVEKLKGLTQKQRNVLRRYMSWLADPLATIADFHACMEKVLADAGVRLQPIDEEEVTSLAEQRSAANDMVFSCLTPPQLQQVAEMTKVLMQIRQQISHDNPDFLQRVVKI